MAKAKSGSSKKRGRGYLGNPENRLSNGKANEKPNKKDKKSSGRGPAAFISNPNDQIEQDEQDEYQQMLDAEEMVGSGEEDEDEEEEEIGEEEEEETEKREKKKSKGNQEKPSTSNQMKFLLGINEKEISK